MNTSSHHFASDDADYLVICTGYTGRLLNSRRYSGAAPWELYDNEVFDGGSRIVCVKDDLWGAHHGNSRYAWLGGASTNEDDKKAERALLELLGSFDGYVVIRLAPGCRSTWGALGNFVNLFQSGSKHSYCGCFDGRPDAIYESDHPALGRVVLMEFDCESG